jgi:hypothetical protein
MRKLILLAVCFLLLIVLVKIDQHNYRQEVRACRSLEGYTVNKNAASYIDQCYYYNECYIESCINASCRCDDKIIINKADTESFEIIDRIYAKDNQSVFIKGELFEDADVATFEVIGFPYTKDKNNIYKYEEVFTSELPF